MDFKKDYYALLGIPRSATKVEIKSAFREMAKKHHPDKNPGDTAADDRFKEINLAYEILGNDITRSVYDEFKQGEERLKKSQVPVDDTAVMHANRKTYTKVSKEKKERRVYVRGEVLIKYWADPFGKVSIINSFEADYKIVPFDV